MRSLLAALLLVAAVAVAGCTSASDDTAARTTGDGASRSSETALTVPAYGPFPAMTVPVTPGSEALCRAKADAFSRAAEGFLRPFPSDADNYRVLARVQFTAFKAHLCDVAILREAVARRLTAKQLHEVLRFFGFMGETARELERPQAL